MTDLRTAAQQALEALEKVGLRADARRGCDEAVGILRAALAQQAEPVQEPDLSRCPQCGGIADNGHDRSIPPNPYLCTKCMAEPAREQVIEDAIEAAYWHFDARKKGLNEWAYAPQSERDAFKAEARKLVRGYFPTRQAQDTKREMLAVADAFIRGKRAALAQQDEPVATVTECEACFTPDVCQLRGTCDYYTASQMRIATPPQSKPLTEEEIKDCFHAARNAKLGASKDNSKHRLSVVEIARAVERAHGIGEAK